MKHQKLFLITILAVVMSIIFAACAGAVTEVPPTQTSATEEETVEEQQTEPAAVEEPTPSKPSGPSGTVTVAVHSFGRECLDPTCGGTDVLVYHGEMYDWFIGATPDGKLSTDYGVLESYDVNEDATIYTFTLKKGIKWQDGVEITSEDIKFTLEYYGRDESIGQHAAMVRDNVSEVEIVDDYTVRLHLGNPDVTIPEAFGPQEGDIKIVPKHYIEEIGPEEFAESPMGSGPWKFVDRRIGEFIEYEANTDYWNSSRIPSFARLRLVLVPEPETRIAMLKRGEVDLIPLEPQDVEPLREEGFKIIGPQKVGFPMLTFFKSYDPDFITNKLEMRKALTLAIDFDAIVEAFYPSGTAERYSGGAALFSPVTLGYDPDLPPYPYDPDEAKRLLEEVGYNGEEFTFWNFTLTPNPEQLEVNEVIASYWREVGLNVELISIDFGSFVPKFTADPQEFDPPVAVGVVFPWARPSLTLNMRSMMISSGVLRGYWNPDKIDMIFEEVSGIVDREERDRRLREVNAEVYEEYWAVPVVLRNLPYAAGPNIADWQPTSGTPTDLAFETLQPVP